MLKENDVQLIVHDNFADFIGVLVRSVDELTGAKLAVEIFENHIYSLVAFILYRSRIWLMDYPRHVFQSLRKYILPLGFFCHVHECSNVFSDLDYNSWKLQFLCAEIIQGTSFGGLLIDKMVELEASVGTDSGKFWRFNLATNARFCCSK